MKKRILCFTFLTLSLTGYCQTQGCTDPKATNYNGSATVNDGSCIYSPTNYTLSQITNLSDTVKESSGLLVFDGLFWTFNDSGNSNQIFSINPSDGKILRIITVKNAANVDWEAMAQSDTHLFIGDFGNNANGARSDLRIYKIDKNQIRNTQMDTVNAEIINFSYPDQTTLTPVDANTTNFDAEAMVFAHDSLHIFSKDWSDKMTRHYTLPGIAGIYQARLAETFNVDLLITDASICQETGNIVLLGYKVTGLYPCSCWLLYDYVGNHYFSGNKRRIELGSAAFNGQTEGIHLLNNNTGYITNEANTQIGLKAKLRSFNFSAYLNNTPVSYNACNEDLIIAFYPNPVDDYVNLRMNPAINEAEYSIKNSVGQTLQRGKLYGGDNPISTSSFSTGVYLITVEKEYSQTIKILKVNK